MVGLSLSPTREAPTAVILTAVETIGIQNSTVVPTTVILTAVEASTVILTVVARSMVP